VEYRKAALAATIAAAAAASQPAWAQPAREFPTKPVRLVAASAPGGGIDLIGRVLAQRLSEAWSQQVVVDNRAGSGGVIAIGIVTQAAPDGHTLLTHSVGASYVGTLYRNAPFDVTRDLTPIALTASQPSVVAVHPSVAATSLRELIQLARAKPGAITYGSGGAGGAAHMGTELLLSQAQLKMIHVPYKGTGPSTAALLSGEVNMAMVGVITAAPHAKVGRIRALAVTGATRSPVMPDVPTVSEAGVPGYEFSGWYAIFAPAGMPAPLVTRLNVDVNRALQNPETKQRLAGAGVEPLGGTQEEFARYFRAEVAKWQKVIGEAGIRAD
jgi:tripartite-type tricarboxylate transporter receptor subunit TctC